jgi:hypothetical protein
MWRRAEHLKVFLLSAVSEFGLVMVGYIPFLQSFGCQFPQYGRETAANFNLDVSPHPFVFGCGQHGIEFFQ